jgi:hypothetical protein
VSYLFQGEACKFSYVSSINKTWFKNDAWLRAENGQYTLEELHTLEQILMAKIEEPVFVKSEFYYYFILYK